MVYISLVVVDLHGKRIVLLCTDVGDVYFNQIASSIPIRD